MAKRINNVNFIVGRDIALRIDVATADEASVKGLQGLGFFLGFSQQEREVQQSGSKIAAKVFTSASYDTTQVTCNHVFGDPVQETLRNAALNGTLLKNVRAYVKDGCDFSAPDQISAGGGLNTGTSGLYVGNFTDPNVGAIGDLVTNQISLSPAGPFAMFIAHTGTATTGNGKGGTNIKIDTTAHTIELLDGTTWESLGFEDGDTLIVDWDGSSTAWPKYLKLASGASSDTITYDSSAGDAGSLANNASTSKTQVHGATPFNASSSSAC